MVKKWNLSGLRATHTSTVHEFDLPIPNIKWIISVIHSQLRLKGPGDTKSSKSSIIMWKMLGKKCSTETAVTQCFKDHPYCLCWLMAELSPSCCWLSAWCKADMSLPRRSGWMFSLLSSHSTSPPSAIVEMKTTRCLQTDRQTDRNTSVSVFFKCYYSILTSLLAHALVYTDDLFIEYNLR